MSTIISIYLVVAISVLAVKAFIKNMPQMLAFIVAAPFAPFIVAWRNRKQRPLLSWLTLVLWLTIITIIVIVAATHP
ncbi:MAG: hypothetical protein H3C41_09685 [Bacteroidales bacterium]|nr:hypothetical protein [Bacteroidales bacterium]